MLAAVGAIASAFTTKEKSMKRDQRQLNAVQMTDEITGVQP
jgi:hypothetical protein